ncbi:MAG TPA: urease accessory protein UreD [Thermomicrobiales bacterium]|nr:urease accessory protein UreD [Thermomicrobiales bacterium]
MTHWFPHGTPPVQVSLVAGAAGPIGGDELRLSIDVGAGAALELRSVAATLVLPGPHHRPSRIEVTIRVAKDGILVWLPKPVIAARNCDHQTITQVMLEPGARLLLREELLLGRHGELPGAVRQRLRVCIDNRPLYDQELAVGPGAVGWDGPAVTGGRQAVGSVLVVDPDFAYHRVDLSTIPAGPDNAILHLGGPAVVVTALARDSLTLHRQLDTGIDAVETALRSTCS